MIREILPWKKKDNPFSITERKMDPVTEFHRQINDIFSSFFGDADSWPVAYGQGETFIPRFEVSDTEDHICITAELPGVEEKDLDVSLSDGQLCIKGEKRSEHKNDDKGRHFSERSYGSFLRSFSLPDGLALDKIHADFKNGVLTVTLPRDKAKQKNVRKIDIKHD